MKLYGLELLRGLTITLGHFVTSYTAGLKRTFRNRLRGHSASTRARRVSSPSSIRTSG